MSNPKINSSSLLNHFPPILLFGIFLNVALGWFRFLSHEKMQVNNSNKSVAPAGAAGSLGLLLDDNNHPEAFIKKKKFPPPPFHNLNISYVTNVYHVGWDNHFGQTNNQLVAILHALDMAYDKHGEIAWDGSNSNSVLAISGWAMKTMGLFLSSTPGQDYNWTQNQLLLSEDISPDGGGKKKKALEQNLPIIQYTQLQQLNIPVEYSQVVHIEAGDAYYYSKRNLEKISPIAIKRRRKQFLKKFLQIIPKQHYQRYDMLQSYLKEQGLGTKYVTIHLRTLDGTCWSRIGRALPSDECDMNPNYIKRLLKPYYTTTTTTTTNSTTLQQQQQQQQQQQGQGKVQYPPIVVITDDKGYPYWKKLVDDPELGPHIIVPSAQKDWDFSVPLKSSVVQDMMIATKSDYFIGPRMSTMTVMIGMMRVARGANPKTNLIFVRERKPFFFEPTFEVCDDCIFFCDKNDAISGNICGDPGYVVYA